MLSRFSSLFTYVIVGLVISAAATPLNPLGDALGDGTKSLSRPQAMKPNDKGKPFGGDKDKSFGGDKDKSFGGDKDKSFGGDRDKSFGGDKDKSFGGDRDKSFGGDRDKSFGGDKDKSYGDKDKSYGDKDKHYGDDRSERHGQCSVENQHCCNQVNKVNHIHSSYPLIRY
jgi:hypothetical protein